METIIVYATKNGTTKKAAEMLAAKLGECDVVDIAKQSFDLAKYDTVIIGSNIRMGTVDKKISMLMLRFIKVLVEKKVAVFLCNCFEENTKEYITHNVPPQLLEKLITYQSFGGELDMNALHGTDKLVAKMVTKAERQTGKVRKFSLNEVAIDEFCKKLT